MDFVGLTLFFDFLLICLLLLNPLVSFYLYHNHLRLASSYYNISNYHFLLIWSSCWNTRKCRVDTPPTQNRISMLCIYTVCLWGFFFSSLKTFVHCLLVYCHGAHVCHSFHLPIIIFPQWNQEKKIDEIKTELNKIVFVTSD